MALTSYNDAREALRESYGAVFEVLYNLRRNIHFAILALIPAVVFAPALWWLWLTIMLFLYTVDTDRRLRMQDRFGRGRGPYLKKKAGLKYGQIEEWSVISTPQHRGGDGIWPLGNNMYTQEEIWCSDDYVRTHAILSGTTGSGKTVTMSSTFIFVALVSDSGVIMIDGKADPKTWFDLYAMAVAAGRADDFLVLNFVVGATQEAEFAFSSESEKELWEEFQAVESNTFNIFGTGTADTLFEIGSGLLGDEASGDNKMWVERAQALLRSMLKALVDLRDLGQLKISIATLQEYMSLEKLSELENNPDISEIARQQVGAVLNEIAGYRDAMKVEDPQRRAALLADQPSKQFAFLHMQFGALYAMLIGTYGHIANVEYSDIYTPDVIRSRRILLVMLPALEKAPTSLAQLGRMATSAIKSALAQNISGSLTGRKADLVDRRPTNSTRAMVLIYDEAASYIQAGTADVASQSRSLGAFNIFSSQEWSSFKQAGDIEATRLISNSGLKIVLKNEDKETADHFMNAVGEATVMRSGGKRWEKGKLIETELRLENVPRVTFQEMMNLAEGQAYIKWRDTLIYARMPYVPVDPVEKAQRNDLVPMPGSMPNDRARMRSQKAIALDIDEAKLPPLNLIEGLQECQKEDDDPETLAIYPLFELITRTLYAKQMVIPWESAAPPRGKTQVRKIYKFKAETMAADLMWALQRTEDERLTPLRALPQAPESRFIIPFLPHEQGLIDPAFKNHASILDIAEETDASIMEAEEALADMLEEHLANPLTESNVSDVNSKDTDEAADEDSDEMFKALTEGDDSETELSAEDLQDDLSGITPDASATEEELTDLSAFLGDNDLEFAEADEPSDLLSDDSKPAEEFQKDETEDGESSTAAISTLETDKIDAATLIPGSPFEELEPTTAPPVSSIKTPEVSIEESNSPAQAAEQPKSEIYNPILSALKSQGVSLKQRTPQPNNSHTAEPAGHSEPTQGSTGPSKGGFELLSSRAQPLKGPREANQLPATEPPAVVSQDDAAKSKTETVAKQEPNEAANETTTTPAPNSFLKQRKAAAAKLTPRKPIGPGSGQDEIED